MAPPSSPARELRSRPRPDAPGSRRPPLRVFEPGEQRARRTQAARSKRPARRATMWVSGALVAGSLLAVVLGDALVSEGQVRIASAQQQLAAATSELKAYQVDVAQKSAPALVVTVAESQGMVTTPEVDELPYVPLDVPLPVPQTAPIPGQAPVPGATASGEAANPASTAGQ